MNDQALAKRKRKEELRARRKMIEQYKPACPDCERLFTAEEHVNRCAFCGYHICDACAQVGDHAKKCKPTRQQP